MKRPSWGRCVLAGGGVSLGLWPAGPGTVKSGRSPELRAGAAVLQAGGRVLNGQLPGPAAAGEAASARSLSPPRGFPHRARLHLPARCVPYTSCFLSLYLAPVPFLSLLSPHQYLLTPISPALPPSSLSSVSASPHPLLFLFPQPSISPFSSRPRFGSRCLTFTRPFSAAVSTETSSGAEDGGDRRQTHPSPRLTSPSASPAPSGIPHFPSWGLGRPTFSRPTRSVTGEGLADEHTRSPSQSR